MSVKLEKVQKQETSNIDIELTFLIETGIGAIKTIFAAFESGHSDNVEDLPAQGQLVSDLLLEKIKQYYS